MKLEAAAADCRWLCSADCLVPTSGSKLLLLSGATIPGIHLPGPVPQQASSLENSCSWEIWKKLEVEAAAELPGWGRDLQPAHTGYCSVIAYVLPYSTAIQWHPGCVHFTTATKPSVYVDRTCMRTPVYLHS